MTISDVLAWSKDNADWKATWQLIEKKWNNREPCPDGARQPFNIDAKLNGAYIALGLLYGNSDFWKTMEISTRAGQDSDCNPSNACGILGAMIGYKRIPDEWKSGIPAIANDKFRYTDFTFKTIVDSTLKRAVALAESTGGKRNGDTLTIVAQNAKRPKLEIWDDYGSPVERVAVGRFALELERRMAKREESQVERDQKRRSGDLVRRNRSHDRRSIPEERRHRRYLPGREAQSQGRRLS